MKNNYLLLTLSGTGATAVYPLLGVRYFNWKFVGIGFIFNI